MPIARHAPAVIKQCACRISQTERLGFADLGNILGVNALKYLSDRLNVVGASIIFFLKRGQRALQDVRMVPNVLHDHQTQDKTVL
jgi:hypothetical protein